MNPEELKQHYGDEYPAAVTNDGKRLLLRKERRYSRSYHSLEHKCGCEVSRFMDGSATITASELQAEWHKWSRDERLDFCNACTWLTDQTDFSDMLRFIMQHGDPSDWSAIALSVAGKLPPAEAFDLLVRALRTMEPGKSANIAQSIAYSKDPRAEKILRDHLETLWRHNEIWANADFTNWIAYETMTTIIHLIELGAGKGDFEAKARQLAQHPCKGNRDSCRRLEKYYGGLFGKAS